jgi:hypothetical protein
MDRSTIRVGQHKSKLPLCAAVACTSLCLAALLALALPRLGEASETGRSAVSSTESHAAMDSAVKANAFREVLKKMAAGERPDPKLWDQFVAAQNDDLKTGPRMGEKVPDFTLPDQSGKQWSRQDLMGPHGLLLVFVRSADW